MGQPQVTRFIWRSRRSKEHMPESAQPLNSYRFRFLPNVLNSKTTDTDDARQDITYPSPPLPSLPQAVGGQALLQALSPALTGPQGREKAVPVPSHLPAGPSRPPWRPATAPGAAGSGGAVTQRAGAGQVSSGRGTNATVRCRREAAGAGGSGRRARPPLGSPRLISAPGDTSPASPFWSPPRAAGQAPAGRPPPSPARCGPASERGRRA